MARRKPKVPFAKLESETREVMRAIVASLPGIDDLGAYASRSREETIDYVLSLIEQGHMQIVEGPDEGQFRLKPRKPRRLFRP